VVFPQAASASRAVGTRICAVSAGGVIRVRAHLCGDHVSRQASGFVCADPKSAGPSSNPLRAAASSEPLADCRSVPPVLERDHYRFGGGRTMSSVFCFLWQKSLPTIQECTSSKATMVGGRIEGRLVITINLMDLYKLWVEVASSRSAPLGAEASERSDRAPQRGYGAIVRSRRERPVDDTMV
jgi:hypothetical protein